MPVHRLDGRSADQLRTIEFTRGYTCHAEGSVLVAFGRTRVLCTASVEERVPPHRRGSGLGWVSAEYGMLPRATHTRSEREARRGRQQGRTEEIQRLIGRSLRSVFDFAALGERQLLLDCDVLQADGGTRTAAITGAAVAAWDACSALLRDGAVARHPMRELVAAVSVGLLDGQVLVDLAYEEDARCDCDMNIVGSAAGALVEVQGTAEGEPFSRAQLDALVDAGQRALATIHSLQLQALQERDRTPGA